MTMTIELQDKLAELTLKTRKDRVSAGAVHEEPSS
jgi:hypothetical protein